MNREDMDADLKTASQLLVLIAGGSSISTYSKRMAAMRTVRSLVLGVMRCEKNNRLRARDAALGNMAIANLKKGVDCGR